MTLASTVAALVLFAFACGMTVGVLATQAWHEHRSGELKEQAAWDEEESP